MNIAKMLKKAVVTLTAISVFALPLVACDDKSGGNSGGKNEHTHEFINYVYNNDATCVTDGTETAKCTGCDETDTRKSVAHPATGEHTFTTYTYNSDATCVTGGTETAKCTGCDETDTRKSVAHPATGEHAFTTYIYNDDATCVDAGTETATCENCAEKDTRVSSSHPATGEHNFADYVCEVCNSIDPDAPVTDGLEYIGITEYEEILGMPYGDIIGYRVAKGSATDNKYIKIPSEHDGKPVTELDYEAFSKCVNLTSVEIPNSVKIIGCGAFEGCSSLTNVEIPCSVTFIDEGAFYDCSSLENIEIPSSVTHIDDLAFSGCSNLTSIEIPSSVTYIGISLFMYCENLTSITVQSGNSVYHSDENCIIETESKTLISGCKSSVIPTDGSVTSIGDCAFSGCGFSSIEIPSSVSSIDNFAFINCENLTSITVQSGNSVYHSDGNCIIETESKTLIAGCKSSVIPTDGSVTDIGDSAFHGCSNLLSLELPNSVKSIGNNAFGDCSSLTSIVIPNSVEVIGYDSFEGCLNLTIYCEAASKPSGWDSEWNRKWNKSEESEWQGTYLPVVWNYKKQ